jgi:hypothetical protein
VGGLEDDRGLADAGQAGYHPNGCRGRLLERIVEDRQHLVAAGEAGGNRGKTGQGGTHRRADVEGAGLTVPNWRRPVPSALPWKSLCVSATG